MIVISIAHSKTDPGAVSPDGRLTENQWSTDISQRVTNALNRVGSKALVFDESLGASIRAINRMEGVTAALEFHLNAAPLTVKQPNYAMAYYAEGSTKGEQLARETLNAMTLCVPWPQVMWPPRSGARSRIGTIPNPSEFRADKLAFLHDTKCPAAIIEIGFITNPKHLARLTDEVVLERMADEVAKAIGHWA